MLMMNLLNIYALLSCLISESTFDKSFSGVPTILINKNSVDGQVGMWRCRFLAFLTTQVKDNFARLITGMSFVISVINVVPNMSHM